jgi:signal transduction histidine kinase
MGVLEAREPKRSWGLLAAWAGKAAPKRYLPWLETVAPRQKDGFGGVMVPDVMAPDVMAPDLIAPVEAGIAGEVRHAGPGLEVAAPGMPNQGMHGWGTQHPPTALGALIHDARNMVTAMELYCDLLAEPGVLAAGFGHYAQELRTVSASSRRMLEKLGGMEREWSKERQNGADLNSVAEGLGASGKARGADGIRKDEARGREAREDWANGRTASWVRPRLVYNGPQPSRPQATRTRTPSGYAFEAADAYEPRSLARQGRIQQEGDGELIQSLAAELAASRSLLMAVAGHGVTVGLSMAGGHRAVSMTSEDLTRVLVNLVRNAAEAMPAGGHLQIALEERADALSLTLTDTGGGIAPEAMESIFMPGYTTHVPVRTEGAGTEADHWPVQHRGLGLAIVRSLVAAAGGRVWAANRCDARDGHGQGSVFTVEFPLRD